MSELPGWIMEIVNNSLSEKKPVSVSRNSFLEKVLGESEMQKLNGWSKQTFFLGTTDDEKPEAPRKSWKALLQDENLTVWNTGGGIYVENGNASQTATFNIQGTLVSGNSAGSAMDFWHKKGK